MPDRARAPGDNRDCRTPAARGAAWRSELFVRRSRADTATQRRGAARSSGASRRSLRFEHVRPANGVIGRYVDRLGLGPVARALGGGAGARAACRRLSGTRLDAGGAGCTTGGGAGAQPRGGGAGGGGGSLFWPSARYPPTPAATITSAPTTIPTLERLFFPAGIFIPARGMGVVGALVTSVGASATAARPGRGGGEAGAGS